MKSRACGRGGKRPRWWTPIDRDPTSHHPTPHRGERGTDHWATESETRDDIVDLYLRVWNHTDATIEALDLDSTGYVPWWNETVPLFNVMVHRLSDATRHAGHADILREEVDGAVGVDADAMPMLGRDREYWEVRCAEIERIARAAGSGE